MIVELHFKKRIPNTKFTKEKYEKKNLIPIIDDRSDLRFFTESVLRFTCRELRAMNEEIIARASFLSRMNANSQKRS